MSLMNSFKAEPARYNPFSINMIHLCIRYIRVYIICVFAGFSYILKCFVYGT